MSVGPGTACVECQTYFSPRKNGIRVMETFEDFRPYKLWQADLLECPDCGRQIVSGYGRRPLAEHFQPNFDDVVAELPVDVTILGCPRRLR